MECRPYLVDGIWFVLTQSNSHYQCLSIIRWYWKRGMDIDGPVGSITEFILF
jgi:hypothetical protein